MNEIERNNEAAADDVRSATDKLNCAIIDAEAMGLDVDINIQQLDITTFDLAYPRFRTIIQSMISKRV